MPPAILTAPTVPGAAITVVPPCDDVAPVTLYVPLTVFVPPDHWTLPAPEIVDAASNERVSLVLKLRVVPPETLNVAPVLVTPAMLSNPLWTSTWLPLCAERKTEIALVPVPPLFRIVPKLMMEVVPAVPLR